MMKNLIAFFLIIAVAAMADGLMALGMGKFLLIGGSMIAVALGLVLSDGTRRVHA